MDRTIIFEHDTGNILVSGQTSYDVIKYGVVLIENTRLDEAKQYGWSPFGVTSTEAEMGLFRVRRTESDAIKHAAAQRRAADPDATADRPIICTRF